MQTFENFRVRSFPLSSLHSLPVLPALLFLPSPSPSIPLFSPLFSATAKGSGGALNPLPQRVRTEPGRQTTFDAF